MGKAGFIALTVVGILITLFGLLMFIPAFTMLGLASWFSAFFAMFVLMVGIFVLYLGHRAKPKKTQKVYGWKT
jgi:cation transporter-like permease